MSDRLDAIAADDALLDSLALGHAVAAPADRDLVGLLGTLRAAVATDTLDGYVVRAVDPVHTQLARLRREALASLAGADPDTTAVERAGRLARRVPAWLAAGGLVVGSVSGVAAAVSGDPFRPYQSVVHHVVQQIQNAAPHFGTAARQQLVLGQQVGSGAGASDLDSSNGWEPHHSYLGHEHLRHGNAEPADDRTDSDDHSAIGSDSRRGDGYRPRAVVRHPVRPKSAPQRMTARPVPTASPVTASPMPTRTEPDNSVTVTPKHPFIPQVATDEVADTPNSTSDTAIDAPPKANEPSNPAAPKTTDQHRSTGTGGTSGSTSDPSKQSSSSKQPSSSKQSSSSKPTGQQQSPKPTTDPTTAPTTQKPTQKPVVDPSSQPTATETSDRTVQADRSSASSDTRTGHRAKVTPSLQPSENRTARHASSRTESTARTDSGTAATSGHRVTHVAKHRAGSSTTSSTTRSVGSSATHEAASAARHALDRATGSIALPTDD